MNVVHIAASVGVDSFGLGPVIINLAKEQFIQQHGAEIWTLNNEEELDSVSKFAGLSREIFRSFSKSRPSSLIFSREMERHIKQIGSQTVVHQHGIWTGLSRVSRLAQGFSRAPVIITPHGALQPWALRKSWWKKKVALSLYENMNLNGASCFHAVAKPEIDDIRSFGLSNPIAVIPNGISESWLASVGDADAFRELYKIDTDKRILLFLSRITPKKGLPMLLESIAMVRQDFSDWILVIAGTDEFDHKKEVVQLIEKLQLKDKVIFTGGLFDKYKRDAFAAADCFVLPSHSEGAPIVILEALGAKVPVIATKASPWAELNSESCGWLTEISPDALATALKDALHSDRSTLRRMGEKGYALVREKYTWANAAKDTMKLYEWLRLGGTPPSFVSIG